MATVTRNFLNNDIVRIEMSADAAEALMQILQVVTHEKPDHPINNEFYSTWDQLVDQFDVDHNYNSKKFVHHNGDNLIVDVEDES